MWNLRILIELLLLKWWQFIFKPNILGLFHSFVRVCRIFDKSCGAKHTSVWCLRLLEVLLFYFGNRHRNILLLLLSYRCLLFVYRWSYLSSLWLCLLLTLSLEMFQLLIKTANELDLCILQMVYLSNFLLNEPNLLLQEGHSLLDCLVYWRNFAVELNIVEVGKLTRIYQWWSIIILRWVSFVSVTGFIVWFTLKIGMLIILEALTIVLIRF